MKSNNDSCALIKGTILQSPELNYEVEEILGSGGFGITYKVSANVMHKNIPIYTFFAVKEHFLSNCCERDEGATVSVSKTLRNTYSDSLADFKAEAIRLNELSGKHKGIVRVNEVFSANNTVYYVMEFLNGKSLRKEIKANGPLTEEAALAIIKEVADAVAFLHKERITHLDIKPDNIIMHQYPGAEHRSPVLIDFGLAKHYDKDGNATSTIRVQGCSEGYSPVEQYVRISKFSPSADVYALGATLFYMLTGKDPIIASEISEEYIKNHLPKGTTKSTLTAILGAMQKDKQDRTATVEQFLQNLEPPQAKAETPSIKEDTVKTTTVPVKTMPFRHLKEKRTPFYIGALVAAIVIIGIIVASLHHDNSSNGTETIADTTIVASNGELTLKDSLALAAAEKEKSLEYYLNLANECCDKADGKSGNKSIIQVLLDAKYYYYDKAQNLYRELHNGESMGANNRIDSLVTNEYNYWMQKGNSLAERRANYDLKKQCYENAYKLRESKEAKTKIDLYESKLSKPLSTKKRK